jgi:hypothetical protein
MVNSKSNFRDSHLVFGRIRSEKTSEYALLYCDTMHDVTLCDEHGTLPSFIYAQTTNNDDIEIIISGETSDTFLVFTARDTTQTKNEHVEYTLLAQTEIFVRK